MTARPTFHTWGPSVYQSEDASGYTQVPNSVLNALCPWLVALMKCFEHHTFTDITRADFIKLLPEEFANITKRTVTNWWARYRALGFITRERDKEKPYLWTMTWKMPWLWKEPEKKNPAVQVGKSMPQGPKVDPPPQAIDLSYGPWAVEQYAKRGWLITVDDAGKFGHEPIEGRGQEDLPADLIRAVTVTNAASILAFLKGTHQRE